MENLQKSQWDESYSQCDNFLFQPHEEVIRFISKHVRKRTGLREFRDVNASYKRLLDLGCGIGRHVMYAHEMGLEAYGIDLSDVAVQTAWTWARKSGFEEPEKNIVQGDVTKLPWENKFFDVAVSHGVLDSMHESVAVKAIQEMHRCLNDKGLFYCDVISGDDSRHGREFCGEEVVATQHEKGTIQLYFNFTKIQALFGQYFDFLEAILIRRDDVLKGVFSSRYHLTLQKKSL